MSYLSKSVPISEKYLLTLEEAAAYFNVGEKKLRELTDGENCPYVLFCGSKRLIKRVKFQNYLEKLFSI